LDDSEEGDEWAGGGAADVDEADEETGMIDLAGRGAAPAIDLDDEIEE
jgi:hypothetical protein